MDREQAIKYLKTKAKIVGKENFNEQEEQEIQKIVKEGKIYGDPLVELK